MECLKFRESDVRPTIPSNDPAPSSVYGSTQKHKSSRPPPVVFKESWASKEARIRKTSAYESHPNWRLLPILVKSNDDLRQEQLASQLIYRMAAIFAKANFVESLAAYSVVCYLLQIKDRHNGNILLDSRGHLIHIDFGFFFLSSPGKNSGFESAPFKLTADFVDVMGGPDSHYFRMFSELCCRTFLTLRRHCFEITLLVEM